ncbi:MAG: hypothetical protein R3A12_04310 [Ignavibacteria bacterium]
MTGVGAGFRFFTGDIKELRWYFRDLVLNADFQTDAAAGQDVQEIHDHLAFFCSLFTLEN